MNLVLTLGSLIKALKTMPLKYRRRPVFFQDAEGRFYTMETCYEDGEGNVYFKGELTDKKMCFPEGIKK